MPNFHPLLVHFPIALIVVIVILDFLAIITRKKLFTDTATLATYFAAVGGALAVVSGLFAEETVWHTEAAHELIETHEVFGLISLGIIVVLAIFRLAFRDKLSGGLKWVAFVIALAGAGTVAYGSYLGGEMVYRHGTGVKAAEDCAAKEASLEGQLHELKQGEHIEKAETEHHEHEQEH